jgi:hypothetical protein
MGKGNAMGNLTLALNADADAAWYGLDKGVGHVVMTPVVRPGGDHIGSGTMVQVCGKGVELDTARCVEKFTGDRMCKRCVAWLESDAAADAVAHAREEWAREEAGPSVADMIMGSEGAHVITLDGVSVVDADAARDAFVAELFAPELGIDGKPWTEGDDPARRVPESMESGADVDDAPAGSLHTVASDFGPLYAVRSGGRWHVGDSPEVDGAEFYAFGEPGDDVDAVARVVCGKMRVVADMIERGEYSGNVASMRSLLAKRNVTPAPIVKRTRRAVERKGDKAAVRERLGRDVLSAAEIVADMDKGAMSRLTADELTPSAQKSELRDAADGTAGKREGQAKAWARTTDGKCAVVLTDETGTELTVTLSGRMDMGSAVKIATLVGHVDADGSPLVVAVGKSAGALAPVVGSDADGVTGVCPVCRTVVKVTGSGGVGSHRPSGEMPDAPQLPGREIPAVDVKGEPTRDASKRREGEAYRQEVRVTLDPMAPVADQVAAVLAAVNGNAKAPGVRAEIVAVVECAERTGTVGLMGARNHGRGDGVAMTPRGQTGYAGWTFDRGEAVQVMEDGTVRETRVDAPTMREPMHGGAFGYLTTAQYETLSKRGKKRYRETVANRRRGAEIARGAAVKSGARVTRADRARTAVGSRNSGATTDTGAHFRHTDVTVVRVGR